MDWWSMPVDLTLNKMSTSADCLCMLFDGAWFLCCQCFCTCFQEVFSKGAQQGCSRGCKYIQKEIDCL
jgi:hypothetical protein